MWRARPRGWRAPPPAPAGTRSAARRAWVGRRGCGAGFWRLGCHVCRSRPQGRWSGGECSYSMWGTAGAALHCTVRGPGNETEQRPPPATRRPAPRRTPGGPPALTCLRCPTWRRLPPVQHTTRQNTHSQNIRSVFHHTHTYTHIHVQSVISCTGLERGDKVGKPDAMPSHAIAMSAHHNHHRQSVSPARLTTRPPPDHHSRSRTRCCPRSPASPA